MVDQEIFTTGQEEPITSKDTWYDAKKEKNNIMAILEEPIKDIKTINNYINGEWVESKGEIIDVVNPATCQAIAKVPISTREEMDSASDKLMADVPRTFKNIAKRRETRRVKLKELLHQA